MLLGSTWTVRGAGRSYKPGPSAVLFDVGSEKSKGGRDYIL